MRPIEKATTDNKLSVGTGLAEKYDLIIRFWHASYTAVSASISAHGVAVYKWHFD
jgi:hypothetical protein